MIHGILAHTLCTASYIPLSITRPHKVSRNQAGRVEEWPVIFSYFLFSFSPDWPISAKYSLGFVETIFDLPLGSVWEEWEYGPSSRFSSLSAFCQSWSWRPPCLYLESSSLGPPSEQGEHRSVYLRYRHASTHTQSSSVDSRGAGNKDRSERVRR